jgi:hypothetical protein
MADFATWIAACEPALGWCAGTFIATYNRNREEASEVTLEDSILVPLLQSLVLNQQWLGTATELLSRLSQETQNGESFQREWPRTPASLSAQLRRLEPNLKMAGIDLHFEKTAGSNSRKVVRIARLPHSGAAGHSAVQPQ